MREADRGVIGRDPRRLLLVVLGLAFGLWILFAKLAVPALIERAYHRQGPAFLNGMIRGQATVPLDSYLRLWDNVSQQLTLLALLSGLALLTLLAVTGSRSFVERFVEPITPGALGAVRALTCLTLLITMLYEDLASISLLPPETRQPLGFMHFVYAAPIGFERVVGSGAALGVLQLLTEVILFLGVVGWGTRVVIPLAALCHFLVGGIFRDYSFNWHQNSVLLYLLIILSFTPCDHGFSLDRLWRVARGRPVADADRPSVVYGWSRYLCWVALVVPYVSSGLSKLRDGGLSWWHPTNMRSMLYQDSLTPREFDWQVSLSLVAAPDSLFVLLGIVTIVAEVGYGTVLFSRTARKVMPVVMVLTHLGILVLQRILFLDLILLQLIFVNFTAARKALGRWVVARRERLEVLYDGDCPLCRRTIALVVALDVFHQLDCLDFRRLDLVAYGHRRALDLRAADLEAEMVVIAGGQVYGGFDGYRTIAVALPSLWPLAPWFFVPAIAARGRRLYARVASSRAGILACDAGCAVASTSGDGRTRLEQASRGDWRGLRFPLMVSGFTVLAALCWTYRVEFYPLTSWQLYSGSDTSGRLSYYKVLGRLESGTLSPVRLEDGIAALALDGRYTPFLDKCFGPPDDVEVCRKFLAASGAAYNRKAGQGARVKQFEIQAWTWDFRAKPFDPAHGEVVRRVVLDLEAEEPARERGTTSGRVETMGLRRQP